MTLAEIQDEWQLTLEESNAEFGRQESGPTGHFKMRLRFRRSGGGAARWLISSKIGMASKSAVQFPPIAVRHRATHKINR
jgi:hypothetical protein